MMGAGSSKMEHKPPEDAARLLQLCCGDVDRSAAMLLGHMSHGSSYQP